MRNLYIVEEWREQGLAHQMIECILREHAPSSVWAYVPDDTFDDFFSDFGFTPVIDRALKLSRVV